MQKNVGGYDRIARFVLGPILVIVGLAHVLEVFAIASGTLGLGIAVAAILVGAVFLVTAATQKCPLNSVLGFDTYKPKTTDDTEPTTDTNRVGPTN
ncbi:DUF2892 domain-containing protein [Halorubellus litoreus]|uniref:DUF2892 domain-containing protein n=1 Tax=Halorubellus litoreus TaxID=755308 RepID=A0ABD5V8W9_9EURY